ncbi:MAG: hypothetical protein ACRDOB_03425 [Streptosporangiaceae bacterium]
MTVQSRVLLVVAGVLIAIVGIVFTLQGLGYVGGSFMTGATTWAIVGPVMALAGLALITIGLFISRIPGGRGGN